MNRLPHIAVALVAVASIVLLTLPATAQAGELTLSVKVIKQDIPVIVGEVIGEIVSLEIIVRNGSNEVQRIPTLVKAIRHGRLEASIYDENGKVQRASGSPPTVLPREALTDLRPQKEYRQTFPLKYFGYHNILTKGKYSIVVKFIATEKNTLTKTVHLDIVDVPKGAVIHSIEIHQEKTARQPDPGEANFIRKIQWDNRYFLYFINLFEGKPVHAVRLTEIPKNSDFVVAGEIGTRRNIHIAFPNLKGGLTFLSINSIDGTVESRRKTDHPFRNWTDNIGKIIVDARLVEVKQGKVWLKKADGVISLPLIKLSKVDQEYIKNNPSAPQIQLWIKQLGDESFKVREEATRDLIQAGVLALYAVTKATKSEDAEVRQRALKIIKRLAVKEDAAIRAAYEKKRKEKFYSDLRAGMEAERKALSKKNE